MSRSVRRLVLEALFIALVVVATLIIRIPVPATQGYVNVGDTMIFVAAVLLGPRSAFLAGAIGSALADILGGYMQYFLGTFAVKGIEGVVAGLIAYQAFHHQRKVSTRVMMGLVLGAAWMVLGYYLFEGIFLVGFGAAFAEVPANLIQGGASVVLGVLLIAALRNVDLNN